MVLCVWVLAASGEKAGGSVTVSGMEYPVYPDAKLHQDLKISVAYLVDAEPADVSTGSINAHSCHNLLPTLGCF